MNRYELAEYLASKDVEPPYDGGCHACPNRMQCEEEYGMETCWRNWMKDYFEDSKEGKNHDGK